MKFKNIELWAMSNKKLLISGGGTGGHIYPAIAIANKFKETFPDSEILFVGAENRMEMQKVPEAGFNIEGLWISGIQRKLTLDNLSFPLKLVSSLWKAREIINRFKPDVVVGVGGFASGPILYVAAKKGTPTLIQEQNSYAGLTNKILADKVDKICVASFGMERFFPKDKIVFTGNPVRQDISQVEDKKAEALAFFGLDENKPVLLVLGGSLGARTINEAIKENIEKIIALGFQILWQVGKSSYQGVVESVDLDNSNLKVYEFIKKMDFAYAVADTVVSRAGALSVSELAIVAKPTIFVPSPNVAEDHQTKNALALVDKDAALMVTDSDLKSNLVETLSELQQNEKLRNNLVSNIQAFAKPKASEKIIEEIIKLIS